MADRRPCDSQQPCQVVAPCSPSIPELYKSWAEDTEDDNVALPTYSGTTSTWDLSTLQGGTASGHPVAMLCTTQSGEAAVCSHSGLQSAGSSHLSISSQYGPLTLLQPYSWAHCEPAAPANGAPASQWSPSTTDQQFPAGLLNADMDAPSTAHSAHAASVAAGWFPPAAALYTSVSLNSAPQVPSLQRFVVQDKPQPTASRRARARGRSGSGVQQERRLQQLQMQQQVQPGGQPPPNTGAYSSSILSSRPTQLQPPMLLPPSMLSYGAAVQSTTSGLANYQQGPLAAGPLAPPPAALDAAGMPWQDSSRFWAGTHGSQGGPAAQYGGVPDSSSHGSSYCITYTPAAAAAAPSYACYSSGDMPYNGTQELVVMPSGVGAALLGPEGDGGTDADISTGATRCSMRWGDRRKHKGGGVTDAVAPLELPAALPGLMPGWAGTKAPPQRQTPLDLNSCRTRVHKPQRSPKRSALPASLPDSAPQPPSTTSGAMLTGWGYHM